MLLLQHAKQRKQRTRQKKQAFNSSHFALLSQLCVCVCVDATAAAREAKKAADLKETMLVVLQQVYMI